MILGIAISHRDLLQTERLLHFIHFLDFKNRRAFKRTGLVLCVSPMASTQPRYQIIREVAGKTFGKVTEYIPEKVREIGWPGSPNQMFSALMRHIDGADDVLFIEPDVAPIRKDWFQRIEEEYETVARPSGKIFMGALVGWDQTGKPHMSGNAVYGRDWNRVAPLIAQATTEAWDTFACQQTMPHAHFTKLIQHVFNNPTIPDDLSILRKETVLFHQNKDGRLINLLNRNRWHGELNNGLDPVTVFERMTKYYHAENCNKRIKSGKTDFLFEVYGQFQGVWLGIFATDDEQQQAALDNLAATPSSAVTAISEADYQVNLKKKWLDTRAAKLPSQEPKAPAHLLGKVAAVADKPSPGPVNSAPVILKPVELPESVESVIKVGKVAISPTASAPANLHKAKKK